MATLYDYYRPHSATLVDLVDNYPATGRGPAVDGGRDGRLVPAQPCIVLDARGSKGGLIPRVAFREDLIGGKDDYTRAHDVTRYGGDVFRSMWGEIVDLRGQLRQLESTNLQLRQTIQRRPGPQDLNRLREYDEDDLVFGKKYKILKSKLSDQEFQIFEYKDKVDHLQKELNRKTAEQRDLFKSISNPIPRHDLDLGHKLREKEVKVRELEIACRKQEQVIEQMEKLLEKKNNDDYQKRTHDKLSEENRKLKSQIQKVEKEQEERERLREEIKEKIQDRKRSNRMEERIRILEKQIAENAKRWAEERNDLLMRLQEAEFRLRPRPLNGQFESLPSNFLSSSAGNLNGVSKARRTKEEKSQKRK